MYTMIEGENSIIQALMSSVVTWVLTIIGATIVFFISRTHFKQQKNILRFSLGKGPGNICEKRGRENVAGTG